MFVERPALRVEQRLVNRPIWNSSGRFDVTFAIDVFNDGGLRSILSGNHDSIVAFARSRNRHRQDAFGWTRVAFQSQLTHNGIALCQIGLNLPTRDQDPY